jgi:hypothetical protein
MEVGVWRAVKVVGVGDVVRALFARTLVWGDVDHHCSGLVTREANGSAIVIEVRPPGESAETFSVCFTYCLITQQQTTSHAWTSSIHPPRHSNNTEARTSSAERKTKLRSL